MLLIVTNLQDKKIDKFKIFNKEDWSSAYQNVEKELTKEPLTISKGNNIKNLNGTLLRNGPGILERGGQWVHHPFDGDGMITSIKFENGQYIYFRQKLTELWLIRKNHYFIVFLAFLYYLELNQIFLDLFLSPFSLLLKKL